MVITIKILTPKIITIPVNDIFIMMMLKQSTDGFLDLYLFNTIQRASRQYLAEVRFFYLDQTC